MICFSCGCDIKSGVVEVSDLSPGMLARWFRDRKDGGLVFKGYACCIRCTDSTFFEALEEAVRSLEERIEGLRRTLQQVPFYQAIVQHGLTPDAHADTHADELLARRTEIERDQEKLFGDPIFANLLRDHHRDVFDLVIFEARALEATLQKQEQIEEARRQRLQKLILRYRHFDHCEDDAWIAKYATENRSDLLLRRQEILREYHELHSDEAFIARLKEEAPHTYSRVTWEVKALAVAEQVGERVETPDEFRERHIRAARVAAEDEVATEMEGITQFVFKEVQIAKLKEILLQEVPDKYRQIVQEAVERYQQGERGNEQKPPPEIYDS